MGKKSSITVLTLGEKRVGGKWFRIREINVVTPLMPVRTTEHEKRPI
jgi:hypothetical protein